eukprot:scaffold129828_cov36-Phaeocystis_antarctica.AAC.1
MDDDAARRWLSPSTEAATSTSTSADSVGWYTARLWPCRSPRQRSSILLERLGPAEAGRGGWCARLAAAAAAAGTRRPEGPRPKGARSWAARRRLGASRHVWRLARWRRRPDCARRPRCAAPARRRAPRRPRRAARGGTRRPCARRSLRAGRRKVSAARWREARGEAGPGGASTGGASTGGATPPRGQGS